MTLPLGRPDVRAARAHLAPYAQRTLDEAGRFAWRIHADEVAVEHLFCTLLADEESAASQAVLHAFADPETIASELMALCPGIMVVGSDRCLPFSARSVLALRAARAAAALGMAARVEPGHVLAAALDELPPDADAALRAAGARRPPAPPEAPAGEPAVPAEGPLFKHFSNASKRGLSTAGHLASRLTREAVSPAHLLLGALEVEPDLGAAVGIGAARARLCLSGLDRDETRPPEREVPPAADLLAFLASAEPGADTLSLLSLLLARGEPEVIQLFTRQKVTSEVLARARGHLQDPETAAPRGL